MTKDEIIKFFDDLPEDSVIYLKGDCGCKTCMQGFGYFDRYKLNDVGNLDIRIKTYSGKYRSYSYNSLDKVLFVNEHIDLERTISEYNKGKQKQLSLFDEI